MEPQTPAMGIMQTADFPYSKFYKVECSCGSEEHSHNFEVEADEFGITVNLWTTQYSEYPSHCIKCWAEDTWFESTEYAIRTCLIECKFKLAKTIELWKNGYTKHEASLFMTRQQTTNYAHALLNAVEDVTIAYENAFPHKLEKSNDE